MRESALPLRRRGGVPRPHRAADRGPLAWAVVGDITLGGVLWLALWFFTSVAFLA